MKGCILWRIRYRYNWKIQDDILQRFDQYELNLHWSQRFLHDHFHYLFWFWRNIWSILTCPANKISQEQFHNIIDLMSWNWLSRKQYLKISHRCVHLFIPNLIWLQQLEAKINNDDWDNTYFYNKKLIMMSNSINRKIFPKKIKSYWIEDIV